MAVDCGVPQGFVLGPLFLIYITDLHNAIQYCKVCHFADDTDLFHTSKSVKNLNKLVNCDMKHLNNWLSAKKFLLTEKHEGNYFWMKLKLNLVEKGYIHETQ